MEEIQINTVFQNRVFMRFFLQKLKNKLHKKIERIALTSTKTAIDEKLATQKIEEDSSLERMKSNLQEITNFFARDFFNPLHAYRAGIVIII